jgi:hypothetical protein
MNRVLKWIVDKNRREMLAFLGGGGAVLVGGAWVAFTYFQGKADVPLKIEATYNVCVGSDPGGCPPNTGVYLACYQTVAEWANKECASYTAQTISQKSGGMCGLRVVQVKCTAGK